MKNSDRFNMRFSLWKDFHFEACHRLLKVPKGHQCGRQHGHSYRVRIHARGFMTRHNEWVVDYAQIANVMNPIIKQLDHRDLNGIIPFETTAENLAFWIGQQICSMEWLAAVEIFETPTTSVFLQIR